MNLMAFDCLLICLLKASPKSVSTIRSIKNILIGFSNDIVRQRFSMQKSSPHLHHSVQDSCTKQSQASDGALSTN